jgi:hypothetical protein
MAYDRYDRDERSRWSNERSDDRSFRGDHYRGTDRDRDFRGGPDDRGFWDRASDEVASWFGDDEAERRRREDHQREQRERGAYGRSSSSDRDFDRGYGRDFDRDRSSLRGQERERERGIVNRGFSDRDNPSSRRDLWGARDWDDGRSSSDRDFERSRGVSQDRSRGYRPMAGNYGAGSDFESEQFFAASGYGRGEPALGESRRGYDRSQTPYGRDEYRRTSFTGSQSDRDFDPHYRSWRDRHLSELDRDYDDFQREHQSRFENDFGSWRETRQHKRGLLGQIREHMEVVGSDEEHVGTVDKVAGDRVILTKSDPDSGGAHHSLSCSNIDRIEGDKVILDCKADEARDKWRDESRGRALFEREDQGEMGPGILDRSFSGTYRR